MSKVKKHNQITIFGNTYKVNSEEAVKIISIVYGWNADKVFSKPASSLQYWLTRAVKSRYLTVSKAMLIEKMILDRLYLKKKGMFSWLKK